ncbi:9785_t:CDS:1 [Diversispora eburnea]|uniref:9785_t:CDS:1 n=1 Tax=Diversispora eburnea TaxID=1213867 RepID=A0A9N9FQ80_9GLOM|nr:9785_t:CDS:1 [Diversispora eburnea]
MATKISIELLIMILNNVQSPRSTQDLYSSLLVNRIWCKVAIPILWELPLGQECMDNKKMNKKALCIRTYISCVDAQARTLLKQNGFDLASSPPQATFDYPSFTHKFRIDNLIYFVSLYSQQIINSDKDNNNNDNNEIIITKSRILFHEICKLIINSCSFLDSFKLARVPEKFSPYFLNYSDLIGSILKLPGAPKVFKKLKSLSSIIRDERIRPLYESLALISDNILNMDLSSNSQAKSLAELIIAQKRLENLSIVAYRYESHDLLFWAIISQKETLKSLCLKSVNFYYFKGKSPIGQFISLQKLNIENCHGLCRLGSDSLFFASSFNQLSSFRFIDKFGRYHQEFVIKILEAANTNLKNLFLDLYSAITLDTFSAILNYCTKITNLTLDNLNLEQIIAIFNNNFNELRSFSFNCEIGLDANKLLCQMAKNVPESLETIEIRMGRFTADSLRIFFEGWCYKGGGENKKIIVKRTEQARLFVLSDEHRKVIEEYGVQVNIEE